MPGVAGSINQRPLSHGPRHLAEPTEGEAKADLAISVMCITVRAITVGPKDENVSPTGGGQDQTSQTAPGSCLRRISIDLGRSIAGLGAGYGLYD